MSKVSHVVRSLLTLGVAAAVLTAPVVIGSSIAEAAEPAKVYKTRKVPTLRAKVYDQLARAQEMADAGKVPEALAVLDEVKDKAGSMNDYELAMLYNFYGFTYYGQEQMADAIAAFKQAVSYDNIPESFEQGILMSLAQLQLMQGDFDGSIASLEQWDSLQQGPDAQNKTPAKNRIVKAQAYYQAKQYAKAAEQIEQAIAQTEAEGYAVSENWFVLQRAIYFELKQPEKVKDVLVKMVQLFDKPEYWMQLAGMYGELGQEKMQLATMESARQKGYVTKGDDIYNLAQLYYYHRIPYKGAELLEQAIKAGKVEKNLKHMTFLAQSWQLAKEIDKAVPAMMAASELANDGELDAQLAQILLNADRNKEAIAAAERALEKGNLSKPGTTYLVLGMAYYNLGEYNTALNQLAEAEKHKASERMAVQWGKYVRAEKQRVESQQDLSASVGN